MFHKNGYLKQDATKLPFNFKVIVYKGDAKYQLFKTHELIENSIY